MNISDEHLAEHIISLLSTLEQIVPRVAPDNLRNHLVKTVTTLLDDVKDYDIELAETVSNLFQPEVRIAEGYIELLESKGHVQVQDDGGSNKPEHLLWMLNEITSNDTMSYTKKNRWLGFIQGNLVVLGYIDVEAERERTRTMFNGK